MSTPKRFLEGTGSTAAALTTTTGLPVGGNLYYTAALAERAGYCKPMVRVATTGNITLSGLQDIDDITVDEGELVLVKNQTDTTENWIYTASSGAWSPLSEPQTSAFRGLMVAVYEGITQSGTMWKCVLGALWDGTPSTNVSFYPVAKDWLFWDIDFDADNTSARNIGGGRVNYANTAGANLTLQPMGSTLSATNKHGGDLLLVSGIPTGTGYSHVQIKAYTAGSSGTTDGTLKTLATFGNNLISLYTEISHAQGEITTDRPIWSGTATWNDGAITFNGLKFNATDTASHSASKLLDLQVGGVAKFTVGKQGGFGAFGTTPPTSQQTYAVTNGTTDRTYDADTVVVAELADVVATLIVDLKTYGLIV